MIVSASETTYGAVDWLQNYCHEQNKTWWMDTQGAAGGKVY